MRGMEIVYEGVEISLWAESTGHAYCNVSLWFSEGSILSVWILAIVGI